MPLLLQRSAVQAVFTMSEALHAAREAFLALEAGRAHMPERLSLSVEQHNGTHLTMPCYVEDPPIMNVKIATIYPANSERGLGTTMAFLVLQDPGTGELLALMDGEHLTSMRTGAACGLAADFLARPNAKSMTVFGAGPQAEAQILAMMSVRNIEKISIVSRSNSRRDALVAKLRGKYRVDCRGEDDAETAVRSSDIVCTATSSATPVLFGAWLREGTHISSVGSFRADMAELDCQAVSLCSVFVDHERAAMHGAGELIESSERGLWNWSDLKGSLGQLLSGSVRGRSSDSEITLYKSVGIAVQDSFAAKVAYERALAKGVGQAFNL